MHHRQRWRMLPAEFREQLQMALHIYLRPAEGAAVADFFDVEKTGSVNGECFVRWFLQAGLDSREVPNYLAAVVAAFFFCCF